MGCGDELKIFTCRNKHTVPRVLKSNELDLKHKFDPALIRNSFRTKKLWHSFFCRISSAFSGTDAVVDCTVHVQDQGYCTKGTVPRVLDTRTVPRYLILYLARLGQSNHGPQTEGLPLKYLSFPSTVQSFLYVLLPKRHGSRNRCRCVWLCALIQESWEVSPVESHSEFDNGYARDAPHAVTYANVENPNVESPSCYM